jgi:hypothetical protein
MLDNLKVSTVNQAICCISLKVEAMFLAGEKYDSVKIVDMIEVFCDEVPSDRWRAISEGVIERLEYWEIIKPNGEIVHKVQS